MSIADDLDAQAQRLEEQAAALREAAQRIRQTELTAELQSVTVASNEMPPKNAVDKSLPPREQLTALRWSVRRLATELAKLGDPELEYSHVHIGRFVDGKVPVPAKVRSAVYKLTGVRI